MVTIRHFFCHDIKIWLFSFLEENISIQSCKVACHPALTYEYVHNNNNVIDVAKNWANKAMDNMKKKEHSCLDSEISANLPKY